MNSNPNGKLSEPAVAKSEQFLCKWQGCTASFDDKTLLIAHIRTHSEEALIEKKPENSKVQPST